MASSFFPALQPEISNKLWFDTQGGSVVDDDLQLLKEETKYNEDVKREVKQGEDITAVGQSKQKTEDKGWWFTES